MDIKGLEGHGFIRYFSMGMLLAMFPAQKITSQIADRQPNIILILTDDQGWGDVGFNGSKDILTPHLDNLAKKGVVFTTGYVSHPYCSPSRAGILTGKYQQRFGHEHNLPFDPDNELMGTPVTEVFIARQLKNAGYRTCAIGKWHLGDHEKFLPHQRGFDHWFGFSGGGMNYRGIPQNGGRMQIRRNDAVVDPGELTYLTDDFTEETLRFISENRETPFFIYLAYNAPHTPNHATSYYLEKSAHIEYGPRSVYAAMVSAVDEGVGRIDSLLTGLNLSENTLMVFLSDNGGRLEGADNRPYRGHKGMLFEGGIRVPFCISWPGQLPKGMVFDKPVISLDLYPTFMVAAGMKVPDTLGLDGRNLVPYLKGENPGSPHDRLFWRVASGEEFAVRKGDFKLLKSAYKNRTMLFDLANDGMEVHDISEGYPELVIEMMSLYQRWNDQMAYPLWNDYHLKNVEKEEKAWLKTREESLYNPDR